MRVMLIFLYSIHFFTCGRADVKGYPDLDLLKMDRPTYFCTVKIQDDTWVPLKGSVAYRIVNLISSDAFMRDRFYILFKRKNSLEIEVNFIIKNSNEGLREAKRILNVFSRLRRKVFSVSIKKSSCYPGKSRLYVFTIKEYDRYIKRTFYVTKYPALQVYQWLEAFEKGI